MSLVVEQIKDRLDIVDLISSYIKIEKAGINWKARCPFHNEKSPSFFVSSTRQSFYCFGCGAKGDIFSFVEKIEGLDFKGALETLASRAGVELKNIPVEAGVAEEKDKLFEIMEETTKVYEKELAADKKALDYLKNRGLDPVSISKWRLGLALDEWRNLYTFLTNKGFQKEEMLMAGLIKKVPEEDKYYDTFRGRIMFPISDSVGRVIAFSGRTIKKEDEKTPKYLNSPETKLFYKSEVLYGFHIAKNFIRKLDYAVLVEGQMDLVMSHQAGVSNTVAASGTALTELHLNKIQKLSNRVIMAYDSDSAGEKAAMRSGILALSLGMEVKIAPLKEGEDPASVIKEDPEAWKKALRESVHIIDFALNRALQKSGREATKAVLNEVLPLISLLKSEIEKSQYVKKIALRLRISEDAVWNDLKQTKQPTQERSEKFEINLPKNNPEFNLERIMASMIFLKESEDKNTLDLRKKWQEITGYDEVEKILEKYEKEKDALVFEAEKYSGDSDTEKICNEILDRIELQKLKQKLQQTAILLDDDSVSKEEEADIKADIEKIQKRIKELST